MFNRIRNFAGLAATYAAALALAAFSFVTGFATHAINYVQNLLPYTVDSAIASLNGSLTKLDRARAKALVSAAAEEKLAEQLEVAANAADARADALVASADRALRIRNRLTDFLK